MTEHEWQGVEALHEQRDRLRSTLSCISDIGRTFRRWRANLSPVFSAMPLGSVEIADTHSLRKRGVVMPLEI